VELELVCEVPLIKHATFGAGCFWGVEEIFRKLPGIAATRVGYMGGTTDDPTYDDVCTDTTGHVEVVEVSYDPSRISYDDLLDVFWQLHDPTSMDDQGPYEQGSQYRGVVFAHDANQEAAARASKAALERRGVYHEPMSPRYAPPRGFGLLRTIINATSKRAVRIIATYSIERLRFLPRAKLNARRKTGRPVASTPNSWVAGAKGERNLVRNTVR
jgi:peptide-methionine (S)-S-oxide reductase